MAHSRLVERNRRVLYPRAPMPRPLCGLADVEEHRDASEEERIHDPLACDRVAARLQAKRRVPVEHGSAL